MSEKEKNQPIFSKTQDVGPRTWGREKLVALMPKKFSGKVLYINKGHKGGLQYHRLKNEMQYLFSGSLLVRYDDGHGKLTERVVEPGETVHFEPGVVHQEEALEDCVVFEVSTPHFNDRVRMEKEYGVGGHAEGLPTTSMEEIEER